MTKRKSRDFLTRQSRAVRYYLKKAYCKFTKIRGEPRQIALGFALGIFVGMLPLMGLQMAIAFFIAALLNYNKISAAAGAWITNPITAPFLYGLSYYIGAKFMSFKGNYKLPEEFSLSVVKEIIVKAPNILWVMTVGGIILGIPLALAGYYLSYYIIIKYRRAIKDRIAKRKDTIIYKEREILKRLKSKKATNQEEETKKKTI